VVTGGRTRVTDSTLRMETMVQTAGDEVEGAAFEAARILELCRTPLSVAEIAGRLELPLGVAMVLVGDLAETGRLVVHHSDPVDIELSVLTRMIERVRSL
jgi:hypothetical protein